MDQKVAVSRVSTRTPTSSSESRRYGALKRPCAQDRPGLLAEVGAAEAGQHGGDRGPLGGDRGGRALVAGDHHAAGRGPRTPISSGRARLIAVSASSERRITVGSSPAWARVRIAAAPSTKDGQRHPSYTLVSGSAADPDGDRGDHAEGALGAEQQLAQVGAGGVGGRRAEVEPTARGGDGQADDQRVEAAVAGAGLAAGAGGGEAADGGELEGLREVAEREPVLGEQRLGLGAAQAGLEGGGHRDRVDGEQPLHPDQVEADQAGVPLAAGGQAAGDRGAAAEGDDREVVLDGVRQDGGDVVVVAGPDHGVGGVGQVAGAGPEQVGRGLAAGAQPPGLVVGEHVLGAEQRRAGRRGGRARGAAPGRVGDSTAGRSSRPKAISIRPRAASGSGAAAAGSPQRLGVHLGRSVMCYSVTHDVTSSQPVAVRSASPRDAYLDAARECILDVGWRRTTLTEVARRAGVSRMTIYRTWSDMQQLLGDLMTREWGAVVGRGGRRRARPTPTRSTSLVAGIVGTVRALRDNELFLRIVELDPELLLPYLLSRRGRSQDAILGAHRAAGPRRPGGRRDPARQPDRDRPRRCCSPPTASCCRRTRWSTTT